MNTIILQSPVLRIAVRPDLGGRIVSLFDRRIGREWLWQNPYLAARPPVYGESYTERLDAGGWDEILPSVSLCTLEGGHEIPDHGDVVGLPARVLATSQDRLQLCTDLRSLPLRFTRELVLEGSLLRLEYALESLGDSPIPFLWAAHPLFALEPGMEIGGVERIAFQTEAVVGTPDALTAGASSPPGFIGRIPDFNEPGFRPFACKLFSPAGVLDRVRLRHPSSTEIELSWESTTAPHLGLWLNLGAWSGSGSPPYFNLGIEPTTSPHDLLSDAVGDGSAILLKPRETRRWSLSVQLR